MHSLYKRKNAVPTLYVKSLVRYAHLHIGHVWKLTFRSYMGPEYSLAMIFGQARRYAPCFLIFEDLDTTITEQTRSYFLNEVDGLRSNDGIFMVGSTKYVNQRPNEGLGHHKNSR
jgi:transitional endoplasmic reticulum ATPase